MQLPLTIHYLALINAKNKDLPCINKSSGHFHQIAYVIYDMFYYPKARLKRLPLRYSGHVKTINAAIYNVIVKPCNGMRSFYSD